MSRSRMPKGRGWRYAKRRRALACPPGRLDLQPHFDSSPLHILVMTDRDWKHPQAGGTGAVLEAEVTRWLDWGHRVSVISCGWKGAVRHERSERLEIHRV